MIPQNTRTLISEQQIQSRIDDLAKRISHDYKGNDLVVIGVLNGAVLFTTDLVKKITVPLEVGFMQVSSYGNAKESSGSISFKMLPNIDIFRKHVLVVEDVLDSGQTIIRVRQTLKILKPASLRFCVFADKQRSRVKVDYTGFKLSPKDFLVGYGMDSAGFLRNLTEVLVVE